MIDISDVVDWLRDGEDWDLAEVLAQCEFTFDYVDLFIPVGGGSEFDAYELKIAAPRRILRGIASDLKPLVNNIEQAIMQVAQGQDVHITRILWVARMRTDDTSPTDPEMAATSHSTSRTARTA